MKRLLFLLIVACNPARTQTPASSIGQTYQVACDVSRVGEMDEQVRPFTEDFYRLAKQYKATCYKVRSIHLVPQDQIAQDNATAGASVIGYCTSNGHIRLSAQIWNSTGLLFSKALLFHELGHCALQLDHAQPGRLNLMTPYMLSEDMLAENWALLENKLFSKSLDLHEEENPDVVFDRHLLPLMR